MMSPGTSYVRIPLAGETEEKICVECGNDLACEGYDMCSECLEEFGE